MGAAAAGATGNRRRLTILSQYFHPEAISTGQLLTELAERLARRGFEVEALCAQPTYYGATRVPWRMQHAGIDIRRVRSTQLDKNSRLGRIVNAVTFFAAVALRLLAAPRDRTYLVVTNPPFLAWAMLLVRPLRRHRFVYLIHDIYPDVAVRLGVLRAGSPAVRLWKWLDRVSCRAAERVIVLGRDMRDVLRGKGVPEEKLRIIENWADGDAIRPLPRSENPFIREHGLAGKFVVMYSGNMGLLHDLESIVGAAARLRERTEMRFVFIGGGGKLPAVRRLVDQHRLDNVLLLPYQPREALGYTLTAADVSLVSLAAGNEGLAVPSKLYGIMAAGSPVVANVPEACEVARVLVEAECGLVVPVGDPKALAGAIARYLDDPELRRRHGSNARREFERRYALERVVDRWVEVLR